MGLFLLIFYYSFSSNLKSKYLETKNRFSNTNEYLAIVKDDGLWIKEEIEDSIYIIHAQKFDNNGSNLLQFQKWIIILTTKIQ